jgi:hypothetical protein
VKVAGQVESHDCQPLRPDKGIAEVTTRVRYGRRVHTLALKGYAPSAGERYAPLLPTRDQLSPAQIAPLYGARGGTMESAIKQDKLGLRLLRRRKHCWHAPEAWGILSDLAHNLLSWSKDWRFTGSSLES